MTILTNGYKLPQTGDFGSVWFPALEFDIQRLNDHNHDGANSEKLSSAVFVASVTTVLAAAFADQGNGYWRASVNTPGGNDIANFTVTVRDPTTKEQIYLHTAKNTATQIYIYTNFVQDVEVIFGV